MKSFFLRILKFLIVIAAVINLLFIFVFDGSMPSGIQLPFSLPNFRRERAETEASHEEEEPAEEEPGEEFAEESEKENVVFDEEKTEDEPEETVEEEPVQRCIITSAGGSNVRSGPGVDYEVVAAYEYNTVLVVTGEPENGWYPIQAEDGTTGYIFETQISMLEDETTNEGEVQGQTQEPLQY